MGDVSGYDADDGWFLIRSLRNPPCRLAACTPRDEKSMPETHFCIKDLLLSSPTLVPDLFPVIGDPVEVKDPASSVFPLHQVHFPKSKTGFPIRSLIKNVKDKRRE